MSANDHDQRLEEAVAFALGSLDPDQVDDFKDHLKTCKRCQEELRWLAPAVRALPEAVEPQAPPPALKARLMAEVRADAEAEQRRVKAEKRQERAATGGSFSAWLGGLRVGSLTWKPIAGLALVILVVAGGIGYAVGTGGSGNDHTHTWELKAEENAGIAATVVREGEKGEIHLAGLKQLPKGKVLEAWVEREGKVEPVPALFAPDKAGNASTTIENMKDVSIVMVTREPEGGSKTPTEKEPFVQVPLET
ncbi:MAG TPA: anti-sigma factor [Solirubrobacterales bacterium]|nr:anti-sigma factor [Solirubrobacterales bacterium]